MDEKDLEIQRLRREVHKLTAQNDALIQAKSQMELLNGDLQAKLDLIQDQFIKAWTKAYEDWHD